MGAAAREIVIVLAALSLPGVGSVIPAGGVTVAVLTMLPLPAAVPVTFNVIEPPTGNVAMLSPPPCSNGTVNTELRALYRVRTDANQAIVLLNKYKPAPVADIAEMYFARGFAEFQLASDYCNGIPLSDGAGDAIVFGKPLPVKDVFNVAIASFDTAMSLSSGTDAASVRLLTASSAA